MTTTLTIPSNLATPPAAQSYAHGKHGQCSSHREQPCCGVVRLETLTTVEFLDRCQDTPYTKVEPVWPQASAAIMAEDSINIYQPAREDRAAPFWASLKFKLRRPSSLQRAHCLTCSLHQGFCDVWNVCTTRQNLRGCVECLHYATTPERVCGMGTGVQRYDT